MAGNATGTGSEPSQDEAQLCGDEAQHCGEHRNAKHDHRPLYGVETGIDLNTLYPHLFAKLAKAIIRSARQLANLILQVVQSVVCPA